MDESIGKLCKAISVFCDRLQSSCDALKQSADRRPIPLDSASTTLVQCLNRRVSSAGADLDLLESMSCDTVSFEELLGHCTQVYNHNQTHLLALQEHLISTSAYVPPASTDTDDEGGQDDEACINTPSLPPTKLQDDPLLDDSLSLKSLGLSDVCLATIASEANNTIQDEANFHASSTMLEEIKGEVVDELMPYEDSKPSINVARADYDSLPELIKGLASWEELIAAVEKMNSSLAKRSTRSDAFQHDEIASLGLGYKARAYLLLLIKMNCMAIQTTDGVISYRVL